MNINKATMTAALSAVIGLSMAGQAAASIYARSYLDVSNVSIAISDDGGVTVPSGLGQNPTFNFSLTNTANLNGVFSGSIASCAGTANISNTCNAASPRLDAAVVNLGAPSRTNNNFAFQGPGLNQYANSDSVIWTAQLTNPGGELSHVEQIAEAELQYGESAGSSAELTSTTGFVFQFVLAGANLLQIDFYAIWNKLAAINDPLATLSLAQANAKVELKLQDDNNAGVFALWSPDGNDGNCVVVGGLTCSDIDAAGNLNADFGVSSHPNSAGDSGSGSFQALITGLYDSSWTLTLNTLTSTNLSRVPEPATVALLGIGLAGLAGMGAANRRRRRLS